MCINMYSLMRCTQLWFRTGVKNRVRYIPIYQIVTAIGRQLYMPNFAIFNAFDRPITSALFGKGKKSDFPSWLNVKEIEMHMKTWRRFTIYHQLKIISRACQAQIVPHV